MSNARTIGRMLGALMLAGAACAACTRGIPAEALMLSPQSLQDRQMQTRRFDTDDEPKILAACAALLQDLGFTIDNSETRLGLVTASKDRDAVVIGEVAGEIAKTIALAFFGVYSDPVYDQKQKLRASVVTHPSGEDKKWIAVRVTFQRTVWNNKKNVSKNERLNEPVYYQEFFSRLSKAVFLEAHEI